MHENRAVGVVQHVGADGADQDSGERPEAPAAEHDERRVALLRRCHDRLARPRRLLRVERVYDLQTNDTCCCVIDVQARILIQ